MDGVIEVRPFATREELAAMIEYFLGASNSFLEGMGVDLSKLPTRAEWLEASLEDAELPDSEKKRFYVAWRLDGELIGHSSISHIVYGETAHCHLHLWQPSLRRSGMGTDFLANSIDLYFDRFALKSLASEPQADNPAPNRVLPKLGFQWIRRYRTVPTTISSEQDVNRYEMEKERWADLRQGQRE